MKVDRDDGADERLLGQRLHVGYLLLIACPGSGYMSVTDHLLLITYSAADEGPPRVDRERARPLLCYYSAIIIAYYHC